MKNKGPGAKIITDYCIKYLDEYRFTTRSNYENYASEVQEKKVQRTKELNSIIGSLDKQILTKQKEYDNAKKIVADPKNAMRKHYVNDLDSYTEDLKQLKKAYKLAISEKARLKAAIPTYEKYLELFNNVASLLRRTRSIAQMDRILRKFYSNLTLEGQIIGPKQVNSRWEVVSVKLKEPYAGFFKDNNFERGRQTNTADEPILLQMFEALLNHQSFKESLDSLNHLVETLSPNSLTPEKQFLI